MEFRLDCDYYLDTNNYFPSLMMSEKEQTCLLIVLFIGHKTGIETEQVPDYAVLH